MRFPAEGKSDRPLLFRHISLLSSGFAFSFRSTELIVVYALSKFCTSGNVGSFEYHAPPPLQGRHTVQWPSSFQ